jgi:ATP-dependent helicase/nuclease subunit B
VQVRFLLGPAGSGKTFRCLSEIRAELKRDPAGAPLLFLAPKQATFQIERQLLADPDLHGYTRLRILSFDRFASFVLRTLNAPVPNLLSDDGRVMLLRALLSQERARLQVYRAGARLPGFAQQLSTLFRELQQSGVTAARLRGVVARADESSMLGRKLADIEVLFTAYRDWLARRELQDGNSLLDIATETLCDANRRKNTNFQLDGVWLDGFAEMTAQELDLLAAALPLSPCATLAFCIDHEPAEELSWLSTWSVVAQTLRRCRARLTALSQIQCTTELLARERHRNRFANSPILAHVESAWTNPHHHSSRDDETHSARTGIEDRKSEIKPSHLSTSATRIIACADPEHEAVIAAREILRHVRSGGRFRDVGVIVRSLDPYGDVVRRVFLRYDIEFFLDRREPVAHHPLAELSRSALRTVSFHWQRDDWTGVLKTGLLRASRDDLDLLENVALARGWEGDRWFKPFEHPIHDLQQRLERTRGRILPPFDTLRRALGGDSITGVQLATAVRELWTNLRVADRLEEWSERATIFPGTSSATHLTVWEQMNGWLDNLALAFSDEALSLRDWLPIVESGLSGLTVGAIPPALDQVLVGTIDRSRNPDMKMAVLLGLNESVFPAPPPKPALLTESERDVLAREGGALGPSMKHRLGHERYYGYIACTRASERLLVTYAKADASGAPLQPSSFVRHLQQLVPGLEVEDAPLDLKPAEAEHWRELVPFALKTKGSDALSEDKRLAPILDKWRHVQCAPLPRLPAEAVVKLYQPQLPISVSALEAFAACPFKFFIARGLGAEEREEFEPDARHRGSFQHELLAQFHEAIVASNRLWRDVPVSEARTLVAQIGEQMIASFEGGVFQRDAAARFTARVLIENVQALAATLITWARHYGFDPAAAELGFGVKGTTLPPWALRLDEHRALMLRGKIDRIDLWRDRNGRGLAVIMDYKSRSRQLDTVKLHHGLELQLLSYLGVVQNLPELRAQLGVTELRPAGVFYINLSRKRESGSSRADESGGGLHQHFGRFAGDVLNLFDTRPVPVAEQFKFQMNANGEFAKKGNEALSRDEFLQLIEMVEEQLREHGRRIFDGVIAIDPYRKGREKACDRCEYSAVCRFDSWTQSYRVLRKPDDGDSQEETA